MVLLSELINDRVLADGSSVGNVWDGDQAAGLRRLFAARGPQVVAFAAGRESSGQTTLLTQTAAALAANGQRVLIIDEHPPTRNALAVFGQKARADFYQVLLGERSLSQAIIPLAPQLHLLPAAQAARELDKAHRGAAVARRALSAALLEMQRGPDFILIDAAVRNGGHLSPLSLAARHMAVVVAARSSAITNAYALIKRIAQERGRDGFQVAVTCARDRNESRAIFDNIRRVAQDHLGVRIDYLGAALTPGGDDLSRALRQRLPSVAEDGGGFNYALPGWVAEADGKGANAAASRVRGQLPGITDVTGAVAWETMV